jgi:hypothetical protein
MDDRTCKDYYQTMMTEELSAAAEQNLWQAEFQATAATVPSYCQVPETD